MESQVQSSSDAGEKDVFCVRMYLLTMEMEVSLFMCVCLCMRMWLNKGQDSVSVFGHGAGPVAQGVFLASVWPSSGKEPSVSEAAPLSHTSLYKQLTCSASTSSLAPSFFFFIFILPSQVFQPLCFHGIHTQKRMSGRQPKCLFKKAFFTTLQIFFHFKLHNKMQSL